MSSTLPFILAAMSTLAPGRDHTELGSAIARSVDAGPPMFAEDPEKRRTAALVLAVAYRESGLRLSARGDNGHSYCAMQINDSSGGTPAMLTDADACVTAGVRLLRQSLRVCAAHPVAWYARGPRWDTEEARRISRDRMALAARLERRPVVNP